MFATTARCFRLKARSHQPALNSTAYDSFSLTQNQIAYTSAISTFCTKCNDCTLSSGAHLISSGVVLVFIERQSLAHSPTTRYPFSYERVSFQGVTEGATTTNTQLGSRKDSSYICSTRSGDTGDRSVVHNCATFPKSCARTRVSLPCTIPLFNTCTPMFA